MTIVRFFPRSTELFPNSKVDSKKYLDVISREIGMHPDQSVWEFKEFPQYPIIKINEHNFVVIDKANPLGTGAMGTVYKCRHLVMEKDKLSLIPVSSSSPFGSIKLYKDSADLKETKETSEHEAKILNRIAYCPVPTPIHFTFESEYCAAVPMRFISGKNLEEDIQNSVKFLNEDKTDPESHKLLIQTQIQKLFEVFDGLLQTIDFLHAKKVAHLDLQASNVILETKRDTHGRDHHIPRLIDFHVSQGFSEDSYATMFRAGEGEGEGKEEEMGVHEWIAECDMSDSSALKVGPDGKSVLIHKNSDIYEIALLIQLWVERLEPHVDKDLAEALTTETSALLEAPPEERSIEKARKNIAAIAKKFGVELSNVISDPFKESYKIPARGQVEAPLVTVAPTEHKALK